MDNIGVSIMVDWMVGAASRAYPAVEKAKAKTIERFSAPIDASAENLKEYLASTGNLPLDMFNEKLRAKDQVRRDQRWNHYLRKEAQTAVNMKDFCSIF